MTARRSLPVPLLAIVIVAALPGLAHAASWRPLFGYAPDRLAPARALPAPSGLGARTGVPRAPVPAPASVGLSQATRTLYATSDTGRVSVIDADRCNARRDAGCEPVATMTFSPDGAAFVAVDEASGTGYVTNPEDGTVGLFDVTRCNAHRTAGCADPHPSMTTGGAPLGMAINARTRTLYVGNGGKFVSVIDLRGCNRSHTAGCAAAPAQIATLPGPVSPTVDERTNTVYVPEQGDLDAGEPGNTVAVIDGSRCNAAVIAGCGTAPAQATVGFVPAVAAVDPSTRTLYVENSGDLNVSVLDASTCNRADTSDCVQRATTAVGWVPNANLVIDQSTRTLFVLNSESDTLSAIDAASCNARDTSGCAQTDRTVQTGDQPFWVELDRPTGTLFVAEHQDDDVAAFDVRSCNAQRRAGCRREAPKSAIPDGVWNVAADPRTHTLWAGGGDHGKLSLLDTRNCRAGRTSGCGTAPFESQLGATDGSQLLDFVFDRRTHTLYAINGFADSLYVLDAATCNTARHDDCAPRATVATPGPFALAMNPRTRVLYIAGSGLALLGTAHCNAVDTGGCAAPLTTADLGESASGVTVDPGTDTAYVGLEDSIAVMHGAQRVGTIPAAGQQGSLVVDRATHTLYAANWTFGETPGSVSVIDTRVCSALEQSGCGRTWPTTPTGRGPFQIALDPGTHRVFTGNWSDASVSVIDGSSCNATVQHGCSRVPPRVPIGNIPFGMDLAAEDHTVYTADAPDRSVSVIDTDAPCRAPVRCVP